jgi:hypothetical protein
MRRWVAGKGRVSIFGGRRNAAGGSRQCRYSMRISGWEGTGNVLTGLTRRRSEAMAGQAGLTGWGGDGDWGVLTRRARRQMALALTHPACYGAAMPSKNLEPRQEQCWVTVTPQAMGNAAFRHPGLSAFLALLALAGLAALASGCAAVSALPIASVVGSPTASTLEIHNNTDVRLQERNFILIKTNVVGRSKGFSLLGVLTMVPATFNKAMGRLYAQSGMEPGRSQTLVNLVMEKDSVYLILFSIPRTSIRADVVEFIPPVPSGIQSPPRPEQPETKTE